MPDDPERAGGPYSNEIAEGIYQARTTIAELARTTGVDRPHLSQAVNGHRLPSAEDLDAIASALGWTWEQLYPREEFRVAIEATRGAGITLARKVAS